MAERLHMDAETRSTVDLKACGPFVYAAHPDTDVWMVCWALDDGPIETWWPGTPVPPEIVDHVSNGRTVVAHNFAFEQVISNEILEKRYGWPHLRPEQGECTAAEAAAMALPRALEQAAAAAGLRTGKDLEGRRLMLKMCRPRRIEDDGTIVWWDDIDLQLRLAAYCETDVEVERQLHKRVQRLRPTERRVFQLDNLMNRRGVHVDMDLVLAAQKMAVRIQNRLHGEMCDATRGEVTKTTQVAKLLDWVHRRGVQTENLDKYAIPLILADPMTPNDVRLALELRLEAAKSSTSKFKAFVDRTSADSRLRDNLMYHGASTGRWSGKGVQLQNLFRPVLKGHQIEQAIADVLTGSVDLLEMFYPSPMAVLSDLVRACIVSRPGYDLVFADFNAIEARVLAWLAGQEDLLHLFRTDGDAYLAMAGEIFGVDPASMSKETHESERKLGKTAVLGCGYGMGRPKFRATCAKDRVYITQDLADQSVDAYRRKNDRIVSYWYAIEEAAVRAVRDGGVQQCRNIAFQVNGSFLRCRLPSGRMLYYAQPKFGEFEGRVACLSFMGVNSLTKKWERQVTYGGRLVENITQAVARDLLAEALLRLEDAGYPEVCSVHDEGISEVPEGEGSLDEYIAIMSQVPLWAEGCPVRAEGWRVKRYRK